MKKFIPLLILLFLSSLSVSAQSRGKKKGKQRPAKTEMNDSSSSSEKKSSRSQEVKGNSSSNPRADRNVGITIESGLKTLSGFGLNGTYYISPKVAVDLGLGIGLQLFKGGIRGRYLFLDKKFTPYVGAGVYFNPLSIDDLLLSDGVDDNFIDINSSTFGQFVVGAEFMGDSGFTIGFNLGYAASLSGDNWASSNGQTVSDDIALVADFLYGSGLSLGLNLGWSF